MAQATEKLNGSKLSGSNVWGKAAQALFSLGMAGLVFLALRWSIGFMRTPAAPEQLLLRLYRTVGLQEAAANLGAAGLAPLTAKVMMMGVALTVGVGGIWALFWVANDVIRHFSSVVQERIRPYIFIGPAALLLITYLIYPAFNTIFLSLTEDLLNVPESVPEALIGTDNVASTLTEGARNVTFNSYLLNTNTLEIAHLTAADKPLLLVIWGERVIPLGLQNYIFAFTNPDMQVAFRNNILWLVVGTTGSVSIGLLFAALVDRIKREALAKVFVFLPLAISFVGASVIWRFVYAWQPANRPQIGLLNAFAASLGYEPIPWLINSPVNTYALIVIMVWLQTGFAMVVLSAALKGVPGEIIEAARIDGANEFQLFFEVIIPSLRGAIITVSTTIFIAILKVFDIVYVMTSGKFDTEVIANRMFVEMFNFRNFGRASALAVILLLVVAPIMVINIRNLRRQGIGQ